MLLLQCCLETLLNSVRCAHCPSKKKKINLDLTVSLKKISQRSHNIHFCPLTIILYKRNLTKYFMYSIQFSIQEILSISINIHYYNYNFGITI